MTTNSRPNLRHIDLDSMTLKAINQKTFISSASNSETTRDGIYSIKFPQADSNKGKTGISLPTEESQSSSVRAHHLKKVLPVLNYNKESLSAKIPSKYEVNNQTTRAERTTPKLLQYDISPLSGSYTESARSSKMQSSHSASILPPLGSPMNQLSPDVNFVLQTEYIEQNPHFSKYNKSICALDKLETSKIPLSKEFFYSPEQMEINKKFAMDKVKSTSIEQVEVLKVLRENNPETIELPKDKNCFFKVYAFDKSFPLKIDINRNFGTFEIFVSKSHQRPDLGTCEYYLRNEHFQVDYSSEENVRYVYIRISALERTQFTISIAFTPKKESKFKQLPLIDHKAQPNKDVGRRKKKMYEFYHDNMNREELKHFQHVINEIRKEKKEKIIDYSSGKNNVEENMMTVHNYGELKRYRMVEAMRREVIMLDQSRRNREHLKTEYEAKNLYNTYRHVLKTLEREWKISEEQQRIDEITFRKQWLVTTAMFSILENVEKRRAEMTKIKAVREMREKSATIIQRYVRTVLYRPLVVRCIGRDQVEWFKEDTSIETKISVQFYEAVKAIVVISRKFKRPRAINEVVSNLNEAAPLIAISDAMNIYLGKVMRIQANWRSHVYMVKARLEIFKASWQQFCQGIVEEEAKKKKKNKQPDMVSKIKENRLEKHAKAFIRERMWGPLNLKKKRDAGQKEETNEGENTLKEDGVKAQKNNSLVNNRATNKVSAKESAYSTNTKGKQRKNSKVLLEEEIQIQPPKPRSKFQPSKEELKEIFDNIVLEIKQELGIN